MEEYEVGLVTQGLGVGLARTSGIQKGHGRQGCRGGT